MIINLLIVLILIFNIAVSWANELPISWSSQTNLISDSHSLKTPQSYHDIILANLNLDNKLEIITTKHLGGIEIWEQDAQGNWFAISQTGLPQAGLPGTGLSGTGLPGDGIYQGLATGDVNSDGKVDIIASPANCGISIWWGDNNLKWNPLLTNLPQVGSYFGLAIADLNLDGNQDIVAASQSGIKVWFGDESGKNWTSQTGLKPENRGLPDYKYYYKVAITDFNLDGKPDIVATNNDGSGVKAWAGDGNGKWLNASNGLATYGNYYGLATADFNLDGYPDIAGGSSKNGLCLWLGDGKGNWKQADKGLPRSGSFFSLVAYDFNLDGNPDIAAGTDAGVKIWLGDGSGNWNLASGGLPTENFYYGLAVSDINLDGRPDVIGAHSAGIQICLGKQAPITLLGWMGQAGYTTDGIQPEYGTPGTSFTYKINYVNAENLPPEKGYPKVGIYKGNALIGTYTMLESQKQARLVEDTTTRQASFADGKFYYFSTELKDEGDDYTYQFEAEDIKGNQGIGTPIYSQIGPAVTIKPIHPHIWAQKTVFPTSQEHYGVAIADVNLDGLVDVVAATPKGVKAWIQTKASRDLTGSDLSHKWQSASYGLGENKFYYGVALVDFNLDGKLDIVATGLKGMDAWLGDGDGRWSLASTGLPASRDFSTGFFYGVICGDFNGDGYPDIVAGTNDNKGVYAWSGDGKGNWKPSSTGLPSTEHLCSVALVDFNSDGNLDIVAGDYTGIMFLLHENPVKFNAYAKIPDLPLGTNFQLAGRPDIVFGRFDGITKGFTGDGKGNWTYSFINLSLGDGMEIE
ncbi:MAG: VCBS repeat-containing protein [Nitrospirota bacterium]